jgi:hypothetical protein
MNASLLNHPETEYDLTSPKRIVAALLALSQDDPWGSGGTSVLNAVEQEIAKYRLNESDPLLDDWKASDCRAKLCAAERELRSEEFREESGLRPWGLLIATAGAAALTDDEGRSPLHWAAENNAWYAIPARALTADAMLQANAKNETPFGIAAKKLALQNIGEDALRKLASSPNRWGETPLHQAARGGYLMCLPQFLKVDELLALEDGEGCSVLERHRAAIRPTG